MEIRKVGNNADHRIPATSSVTGCGRPFHPESALAHANERANLFKWCRVFSRDINGHSRWIFHGWRHL